MRIELKGKLLISNDNNVNPTDVVFNSGDKSVIDSSTFAESTSKLIDLPPSTVEQQVNLDNIAAVAAAMLYTDNDGITVILVPTGGAKADCSAIKLRAGYPMVLGSDLKEIYLSNTSSVGSAKVRLGAAGN